RYWFQPGDVNKGDDHDPLVHRHDGIRRDADGERPGPRQHHLRVPDLVDRAIGDVEAERHERPPPQHRQDVFERHRRALLLPPSYAAAEVRATAEPAPLWPTTIPCASGARSPRTLSSRTRWP